MKKIWNSYLPIVLVLLVVAVSGFLQYRWQVKIGNADIEKMQAAVDRDVERFSEDFNKEIQSAYFNFQIDADTWRLGNADEFTSRFEYWKQTSAYPELISAVWMKEAKPNAELLKYSAADKRFVPAEDARVAAIFADNAEKPIENVNRIDADLPALILPIGDMRFRIMMRDDSAQEERISTTEKYGDLVLVLDKRVISERILPDLAKKYFPANDFSLSVRAGDDTVFANGEIAGNADAEKGIFSVSPNMMIFASTLATGRNSSQPNRTIVVDRRLETKTITATASPRESNRSIKIETRSGLSVNPPAAVSATNIGAQNAVWQLAAQHRSGSIKRFVDGNTWRDILIGFGLLLLIAVSILAIFFSARRTRLFAQRQVDFVSSVSHEFRTPLAVIYAAGENLADGIADNKENVAKYGNLIKGEGRKLNTMVDQILEFAGASSGKRKFKFDNASVKEIIIEAINESSPILDDKGFTVDLDLAEDIPVVVADRDAIANAVKNLIANSAKYSNGSQWIGVSVKVHNDHVRIGISDRGIGISRKEINEIFEPFYRSKDVVDEQIHGNGLGLSIVKQIVDAHNGKVSVNSVVGKGSEFFIDLPFEPANS